MALYVGWEALNDDTAAVYSRVKANQINGIIGKIPARGWFKTGTPNAFANSGINNPNRGARVPYAGRPGFDIKAVVNKGVANAAETVTASTSAVDGPTSTKTGK